MRATKIYYQKCFNLGDYEHEVIGIELEVNDGEKAVDVFNKAKEFTKRTHYNRLREKEINNARSVLNDPDSHTGAMMKQAQQLINEVYNQEDLPF